MLYKHTLITLSAVTLLAACGTKGSWMGAEAEKAYDKELEAQRLAADKNHDDYYEIHQDGRVFVLSDTKGYKVFKQTGEIPLVVTKIGGGLNGETVKFALTKTEAKAMEKKVGFTGGAQNLYERRIQGLEKGFYGQVEMDGRIYVFNSWPELDRFRSTGRMQGGQAFSSAGPNGETVIFAQASEELQTRFKALIGK
ncbi:MAG: hypothetical protein L0Y32_01550 [Nevskiales bacterium]|nr:hypothetical protein [Nevskiales bacterium]